MTEKFPNQSVNEAVRSNGLTVVYQSVAALKPHPRNPRKHDRRQVQQIVSSIRSFGWTNPILVDEQGYVICGAGRLLAARALGYDQVPTILIAGLTEAQIRAYVLADNKLCENAGWDKAALAAEFKYLIDLDFDVSLTGFSTTEIDLVIGENLSADEDQIPTAPEQPVSRLGDLWLIGDQLRLLCGDALDTASYQLLLGSERARMVFTDPPYNLKMDLISGLGRAKHGDFAMASGEMSDAQFSAFLSQFATLTAGATVDGSLHYICMDWRHVGTLLAAAQPIYSELKNICVWAKTNGGMGSFYRSQHELICLFKNGKAPHTNNIDLGRHGRYRTNLWSYPGSNTFRQGRIDDLTAHPTVKPVQLVADAILDASARGEIVLDPFSGAGTTLAAAHQVGRRCFAIELDSGFVDVSIARIRKNTGLPVIHAETGMTFDDLQIKRKSSPMTETGND